METVQKTDDLGGGRNSPSSDRKEMINQDVRQDNNNEMTDIDVERLLNRPRPFSCRMGRRSMYEAPEFVTRLNAFEEAEAGSTVIFECQWKGFPRPAIKWYKDDEEVTENPRYQTTTGDKGILALVIEDAKKEDEGAYKCKAENQEGVASTTGYLSVSGDVEEKPPPPPPQPKKPSEHVSTATPLKTILEQRTLEAEEEEELYHQPPSPIQDFLDSLPRRRRGKRRRSTKSEDSEEADEETSGSDTSVDSQDFDRVPDQDRDLEVDKGQGHYSISSHLDPQEQVLEAVQSKEMEVSQTQSQNTDQGHGQYTVSQEVGPEEQLQVTPNIVVQDVPPSEVSQEKTGPDPCKGQGQEVPDESEESLARVPSDKAMSMFIRSVSELTPSPSMEEPEMENSPTPASAQLPSKEQSSTEFVQFEVKPANPQVLESNPGPNPQVQGRNPGPEGKKEEAAGQQRTEMVLNIGSSQPTEAQAQPATTGQKALAKAKVEPKPVVKTVLKPTEPVPQADTVVVKSTENLPQVKVESTPVTSAVVLSTESVPKTQVETTSVTPVVITTTVNAPRATPVVVKSTENVPQAKMEPVPATPVVAQPTGNVPQAKIQPTPVTPTVEQAPITPTVTTPAASVAEPKKEPGPAAPIVVKSTENVPQVRVEATPITPVVEPTLVTPTVITPAASVTQTGPGASVVIRSTENVPQAKVEPTPITPSVVTPTLHHTQTKIESVSVAPVVVKSTENVPQVRVEPTPIAPAMEPTPAAPTVITPAASAIQAKVEPAPVPTPTMQTHESVPQTKAVVSPTTPEAAVIKDIAPKTHVIMSEQHKQRVVISTNQQPSVSEVGGTTTAVVSPTVKQGTTPPPGVTVILETAGKEAKAIEAAGEGTVSNIIKLVKQKSMAVEETLRIPWLYYIAFIVVASFIAEVTHCSPFHYIVIIAVVSLISFRVLVEITCKEDDVQKNK